jgi:uncharacterized repeat protein (TIGR03803 family)
MNCNRFRVHRWLPVVILSIAINASAEWNEKVLYSFQGGTDGATPAGGVVFDSQGNLYGATSGGGSGSCAGFFQCGTVYQLSPHAQKGGPWTETVLHNFQGNKSGDGTSPGGGLVIDKAGNLYGTTGYGGTGGCVLLGSKEGCGTVYELSPPKVKGGAWTEKVLYSFKGGNDGYVPDGDLVFDSAGNLYGATLFGGGKGTTCNSLYQYCGTVFELSPPQQKGGKWTEKVLHSFAGGTDGANPNGGLVFDGEGFLFGTAYSGGGTSDCYADGVLGCGTVFQLKPPTKSEGTWTETTLHRFHGGSQDTNTPMAGLTWDTNGNLYGSTAGGQNSGGDDGAVYQLSKATKGRTQWVETLIRRLSVGDGVSPMAELTFDGIGRLFGTASAGGASGGGTVFRLELTTRPGAWTVSVLHAFTGTPDGSYPASRARFDRSGNLYSTTQQGGNIGGTCGNQGCGTVFIAVP